LNEVTLSAEADPKRIDGGLEIAVTGTGRTLVAIQRMVPVWAQTMNGHQGWGTKAVPLANGELLTVTATDPREVQHIRGLGFTGLLVSASMHQPHHVAMAKAKFDHEQLATPTEPAREPQTFGSVKYHPDTKVRSDVLEPVRHIFIERPGDCQ
jgi:hypothetical protein